MMIRRSKRSADRLDAFLEGRSSSVPDDLAALAETAEELRAEARALDELPTSVASAHVAAALSALQRAPRPAPMPAPVRVRRPQAQPRWRVQLGAALAGAALLMVPAGIASASALPGDVLYPVKRGVEQVRLVAALSPQSEAETRTQIAQTRLTEVRELLSDGRWEQVPEARQSLGVAHADAMAAVTAARLDGAEATTVAALETELATVPEAEAAAVAMTLDALPPAEAEEVRTLIANPGEGGTGGATPTRGPEPTTVPGAGTTPTPSVTPEPTPAPGTSTSSSTTTTTTTTTTSTTSTTTTTLPPDSSIPTPSGATQEGTPVP